MASRPKHALSENEISALAGVSVTSWKAHKAQGCPTPKSRADLPAFLKAYHSWRVQHGKVAPGAAARAAEDPETARLKREGYKWRATLAEIEARKQLGQLVPRRRVVEFAALAAATVRQRLQLLVRKGTAVLGPLCGKDGELVVQQFLADEVRAICAAFERGLDRVHEDDATTAAGSGDPPGLPAAREPDGL